VERRFPLGEEGGPQFEIDGVQDYTYPDEYYMVVGIGDDVLRCANWILAVAAFASLNEDSFSSDGERSLARGASGLSEWGARKPARSKEMRDNREAVG
jgi:hypothetical protein